jgi:hypothetical protein
MPGLDPGIHRFSKKIDRRVKPGDDEIEQRHHCPRIAGMLDGAGLAAAFCG